LRKNPLNVFQTSISTRPIACHENRSPLFLPENNPSCRCPENTEPGKIAGKICGFNREKTQFQTICTDSE
jgi:hypothetical protein